MNFLLLNVLLALAWAALNGEFTPTYLVTGFILGYGMLWVSRRALDSYSYVAKVPRAVGFALYFAWELFLANLRVAWEVLTPGWSMKPAIVAVPLDLTRDSAITLLAQLITLTPGTLSIDISTDKRTLYIHSMYTTDIAAFRHNIKNGFEKRVQELFS